MKGLAIAARSSLAAFLSLMLVAIAPAQTTSPALPLVALGYCQITSLGSAVTLAGGGCTVPSNATAVYVEAETQAVRYRDDGVAPTAGVGMPIAQNGTLFYAGNIAALQFIQQTASAKLNVLFYK